LEEKMEMEEPEPKNKVELNLNDKISADIDEVEDRIFISDLNTAQKKSVLKAYG
jgi:hypothetical protein